MLSDINNYKFCSNDNGSSDLRGKHSILSGLEQYSVTTAAVTAAEDSTVMPIIAGQKLSDEGVALGIKATTSARTFCIPIMNFLSYSDKYIPLFAMTGAPLRLEIQLVSTAKLAVCSHTSLNSFAINNVEYICNFMEISDSGMAIVQKISGNSVHWVVQDYRNYPSSATIDTNAELTVPLPAKFNSLRSILVSFRGKYAGGNTYFPLESSNYALSEYTFRLGSRSVPTKAPGSIPEFFAECLRAIGSVSDLNHEPSINLDSYDAAYPIANDESATKASSKSSPSSFYVGLD